jgi:uncharacterized repeat protein (TIGR03803 family)
VIGLLLLTATATLASGEVPFDRLHRFVPSDGGDASALIEGTDGFFYGTSSYYGSSGWGTVFRVSKDGGFVVLHHFTGGADGGTPYDKLLQASDGYFYGTTRDGGTFNGGTVFRIAADGAFEVMYAFNRATGIHSPASGVAQARDGHLYGTASGGAFNGGVVFRLTLSRAYTVLHDFAGGPSDGASPSGRAALMPTPDGSLLGTTQNGGVYGRGTIYRMTPSGAVTVIRSLDLLDGDYSLVSAPGVLPGHDGHFYLTTPADGKGRRGELFRIAAEGQVTLLLEFAPYEASPMGSLVQGRDGHFYGAVRFWRSPGGWVMAFARVMLDGSMTALYQPRPDDGIPFRFAALAESRDGHFYGAYDSDLNPLIFRLRVFAGAPTKVILTTRGGSVLLHWAAVPGAVSYTLRRGLSQGRHEVLAIGLAGISYADGNLQAGQRYYYVVTALNEFGESVGSYEVSATAGRGTSADFTGDAKSDLAIYRPSTAEWYVRSAEAGSPGRVLRWGAGEDVPIVGDFDGDGAMDPTIWRPSTAEWYILFSSSGYTTSQRHVWGAGGDVPLAADFDGDGRTDLAVYREYFSFRVWYVRLSSSEYAVTRSYYWGAPGDVPVVADFDGDGRTELTVYRPTTGQWFVSYSTSDYQLNASTTWGAVDDLPVAGDFDGDGKTEIAVYRPLTGRWFLTYSSLGYVASASFAWGMAGDRPMVGDYDGDGRTDLTVYRPSTGQWFVAYSSLDYAGSASFYWGAAGDIPLSQP